MGDAGARNCGIICDASANHGVASTPATDRSCRCERVKDHPFARVYTSDLNDVVLLV